MALEDDARALLGDATVFLRRSPKDRVRAERTGDMERGIAAELRASLSDRAALERVGGITDAYARTYCTGMTVHQFDDAPAILQFISAIRAAMDGEQA
jgi:hypothetical protein